MNRIFPVCLLILLSGCSIFGDKGDETEGWTVERFYAEARGALDSGDYDKAIKLYQALEARFSFGVYGQQAILDLAYAHYRNAEPEMAIDAADRFITLYPQNEHVAYAYYLKGLVNFHRDKGFTERFFPLDESQRDPGSALQAFQDFSELNKRYPNSRYAEDARLRMTHLRNVLAQHEVNVAHYYMRRGAYLAAANRAAYVIERYMRSPAAAEALELMARAYKVMGFDDLSADALRVLKLNYPDHRGLRKIEGIEIR